MILDSFETRCQDAGAQVSHSCVCHIAAIPKLANAGWIIPAGSQRVEFFDPALSDSLFSKHFFHPPKVLA